MGTQFEDTAGMGLDDQLRQGQSSLIFMDNMRCMADLIFGGVCHRFPDLKLVSVESRRRLAARARSRPSTGSGATAASATSTPSTTCCRASTSAARSTAASGSSSSRALDAIARYPDNILFETDYPHPTCQHPGPRTPGAAAPRLRRPSRSAALADDVLGKVLHDNAAAVYGL